MLAQHGILVGVRQGVGVDDDGFLAGRAVQPRDQLQPQAGQGAGDMLGVGLPACVAGQKLPRERVAQAQGGHEIQGFRDQRQHLPVGGLVRDAELPLDGAEWHHGFFFAHLHHHDGGRVGVGAAKERLFEQREHAVGQLAVRRCVGVAHSRQ